jgi:hypothetical protein
MSYLEGPPTSSGGGNTTYVGGTGIYIQGNNILNHDGPVFVTLTPKGGGKGTLGGGTASGTNVDGGDFGANDAGALGAPQDAWNFVVGTTTGGGGGTVFISPSYNNQTQGITVDNGSTNAYNVTFFADGVNSPPESATPFIDFITCGETGTGKFKGCSFQGFTMNSLVFGNNMQISDCDFDLINFINGAGNSIYADSSNGGNNIQGVHFRGLCGINDHTANNAAMVFNGGTAGGGGAQHWTFDWFNYGCGTLTTGSPIQYVLYFNNGSAGNRFWFLVWDMVNIPAGAGCAQVFPIWFQAGSTNTAWTNIEIGRFRWENHYPNGATSTVVTIGTLTGASNECQIDVWWFYATTPTGGPIQFINNTTAGSKWKGATATYAFLGNFVRFHEGVCGQVPNIFTIGTTGTQIATAGSPSQFIFDMGNVLPVACLYAGTGTANPNSGSPVSTTTYGNSSGLTGWLQIILPGGCTAILLIDPMGNSTTYGVPPVGMMIPYPNASSVKFTWATTQVTCVFHNTRNGP